MYLEYQKKVSVLREMLERSVMDKGECPDKKYINQLLDDIDTRMPIFQYEKVNAGERFDTEKLNDDLRKIKEDLGILYAIVTELAGKKYVALEAYVNAYLSSLENIADEADERARQDYEATTLGAHTVYFKQGMPEAAFENGAAVLSLGDISCTAESNVYGVIEGYGFSQEDVAFDFGSKRISPYSVNRETVRTGGTSKRETYTYTLPANSQYHASFKIANSNIPVDDGYAYAAYGGANKLSMEADDETKLTGFLNGASYTNGKETRYRFYLMNATRIRFDFSEAPESRSFTEDDSTGLKRNNVYAFDFVMKADASFTVETDGIVYATKEKLSVNGGELYVSGYTKAEDFIIYVTNPGDPVVLKDVKVRIYGAKESEFSVTSVAVKEYTEESA